MSDEKTVYITDDGYNTVFTMFIADTAGDLSSGTLYASNFTQVSSYLTSTVHFLATALHFVLVKVAPI
jgi:hypothetical protein